MIALVKGAADRVAPNVRIEEVSKDFGPARVLDGVSFELAYGEVHGLLGHNGSGKSTLIKVLTGVHAPNGGRVWIGGTQLPLPLPPGDFNRYGIAVVHQALGLVPSLTVTENLLVRRLVRDANVAINWQAAHREVAGLFAEYGLTFNPRSMVSELSPVERALLAIIRAFHEISQSAPDRGGLLILDEPTPFLPQDDVERLFTLVRRLTERGTSVIFVSHDIDEVIELTDRATVLRNGRVTATLESKSASKADFITAIVGRELHTGRAARPPLASEVAVTIKGLSGPGIPATDVTLQKGEVLGITGLIGSGYDHLPYLVYGARPASDGTLTLGGTEAPLAGMTPARAMQMGVVLVPGDRQGAAIAESLSVAENMALPALGRRIPNFCASGSAVLAIARDLVRRFDVKPPVPDMAIKGLSGGNQQKVVLAKWLQSDPALILLDEPTQGVDVGARQQVYEFIQQAAEAGACVICASSDHEQLETICDRVLVFSHGQIVASLSGEQITKHAITERCLTSVEGTLDQPKDA
ncbi:MAG: rbsA 2 [Devosia sp.]|nr:rbsA 2 [Devosia sp.]